jgi:EAL domain-containing protein (putative c-di-GMP-specific phosphodiesterase class I)
MEHYGADFSAAYGDRAGAFFAPVLEHIRAGSRPWIDEFYERLDRSGPMGELIARLLPEEFEALKAREADAMAALCDPHLTISTHRTMALDVGRTHALTGVDLHWIVDGFAWRENYLAQQIVTYLPPGDTREQALRVLHLRILYDLREQSAGYRSVSRDVAAVQQRINRVIASTGNLFDLVHGVLAALESLPGNVSGFFSRVDERHELQIEATFGNASHYSEAMESGRIPKISVDSGLAAGRGPTGRSWRSGSIVVSDAYALEPDRDPWRRVGHELGFRSSAAVPLVDEDGVTIANITLYSRYPGFFSTGRIAKLLDHLHDVMSHAAATRLSAPVIPRLERLQYRKLLANKSVIVHYQPIVDLRTGQLSRVEALARLQDHAGNIVLPGEFLHALGDVELLNLFSRVLRQACADLARFAQDAVHTPVAINIPAQALGDARYLATIFALLEEYHVNPTKIVLEVLETQGDASDAARHEGFMRELRHHGIEIEQDDLGGGHSSLVRMDRYPFDAVKIDQELVRGSLRNPHRALEFILYLTRLAHALQTPVTVEGLESVGVLEAAAILGADRGQGYAIARPMPASHLAQWYHAYRYPVDVRAPATALGAMAAYLIADLQPADAPTRALEIGRLNDQWLAESAAERKASIASDDTGSTAMPK